MKRTRRYKTKVTPLGRPRVPIPKAANFDLLDHVVAFELVEEEGDVWIYVTVDGNRIAYRGKPNTPQAKTWVSVDPDFRVIDRGRNLDQIEIQFVPANPSVQ
jgi:hypothetical protein